MSHFEKTLFQKLIDREIPADIVYEDDLAFCFRDISPQAPVHVLLIPKKPVPRVHEAGPENSELLGHLMGKIPAITEQLGLADSGYRIVINNGADGGETVPHMHIHILGGRPLTWPPG